MTLQCAGGCSNHLATLVRAVFSLCVLTVPRTKTIHFPTWLGDEMETTPHWCTHTQPTVYSLDSTLTWLHYSSVFPRITGCFYPGENSLLFITETSQKTHQLFNKNHQEFTPYNPLPQNTHLSAPTNPNPGRPQFLPKTHQTPAFEGLPSTKWIPSELQLRLPLLRPSRVCEQ